MENHVAMYICNYCTHENVVLFNLQLFTLGALIPASIAIPAIKQVGDFLNSIGNEYEDADSYRGAAGWLIFVASAAMLCHIAMFIVRSLYMGSVIERHLRIYGVIVSAHDHKHT